jgi:hypothetical protein
MRFAIPLLALSFLAGDLFAKDSVKTAVKAAKDSVKAVMKAPKDSAKLMIKPAVVPAPVCSVARIAFAMRIDENRETIGEAKAFPAAVKQIYCWSQLDCGNKPVTVKHVWYKDGRKMDAITIAAKSGHSRVASRKTIVAGAWKVEVVKDSAQVIGSGEVTIK